jgi:hypothetical protein
MTDRSLPTEPPPDCPPARRRNGWSTELIAVFLEELRATATVSDACRAVGKSRSSAYRLYNREDAGHIRAAWDEALRAATRVLADTAFERAVKGTREDVYHEGELVGYRTRHDNRHLQWMLRVRDPLNWASLSELEGWMRHRDGEAFEPAEDSLHRMAIKERKLATRDALLPAVDGDGERTKDEGKGAEEKAE